MNSCDLFLLRYRFSHPGMSRRMLADLTEDQARTPHCPGVNTLAWLVWHMARTEDIGLNRFVTDGEQVFDAAGRGARPGVARRELGTGMTPAEVRDPAPGSTSRRSTSTGTPSRIAQSRP